MNSQLIVSELLTDEQTAAWTTEQDRREAAAFASARRRAELLTWRAMVRRAIGREVSIGYNPIGAPILHDSPLRISVSHCTDRVAVCICENPCGVDIERADRNFLRALPRYLSDEEQGLCADPRWPGVAWCAKETLYKYAGEQGLDLLEDLHLLSVDLATGTLTGQIKNGEPIRLSVDLDDQHLLVSIR